MASSVSQSEVMYDTGGRGICIIIANYVGNATHALPGYNQDVKSIIETFSNTEKFDFELVKEVEGEDSNQPTIPLQNLSKAKFEKVIRILQNQIRNRTVTDQYDKFVMFVLSHGSEEGVLMCPEDGKVEGEYVSVDYIIESFTHQNVPCLKGKPKCFFFQACRGNDETRAASCPAPDPGLEINENRYFPAREVTKANILVAFATLPGTRAYVANYNGSLFIDHLCKVLKEPGKEADLISVLTKVNAEISQAQVQMHFPCNDEDYKFMIENQEVVIVGKLGEKYKGAAVDLEKPIPLEIASSYYNIHDRPEDYNFDGDIEFKHVPIWKGSMEGADLLVFLDNPQFTVRGTLESKIIKGFTIKGHIEKYEKLTVDGISPRHGLVLGDISIMAQVGKEMKPTATLENNPGELHVKGVHYDEGKFQQAPHPGKLWGLSCDVRQMTVFYSTLTKRLVLSKKVQMARGELAHDDTHPLQAENNRLRWQNEQQSSSILNLTNMLAKQMISETEHENAKKQQVQQPTEDREDPSQAEKLPGAPSTAMFTTDLGQTEAAGPKKSK